MKELENCPGIDMKQNSDKIMADKMKGTKTPNAYYQPSYYRPSTKNINQKELFCVTL